MVRYAWHRRKGDGQRCRRTPRFQFVAERRPLPIELHLTRASFHKLYHTFGHN